MISIDRLQPDDLLVNQTFSQVVVAQGSKLVFTSGQVAIDKDGNLVGGADLGAQTTQAMQNLVSALKAAGATFDDVVKTTTFVVGLSPDQRKTITDAKTPFYGGQTPSASALIGVSSLARPEWLIEIEAIAVLY